VIALVQATIVNVRDDARSRAAAAELLDGSAERAR